MRHIISAWKDALRSRTFFVKILLTPGLFFLYSAITQRLGDYVESRKGTLLSDKLLYLFPTHDFSFYVFLVLYTSLSLVVITHLDKPKIILRIIEMHFAVAVVRQICILLVALEPPAGMVVLRDVFLENTVYPHHSPMTKDLFFSGHVASIWIYFLCAEKWIVKRFLFFSTLAMTFMILSMKVHYTYDVYGAFVFTSLLYFMPVWIRNNALVGTVVETVE